jgi:predicted RecB family nuclease
LKDTTELLVKEQPPNFYKVSHCTECQFKTGCYKKLKDKDCISLLAGMTAKAIDKFHKKELQPLRSFPIYSGPGGGEHLIRRVVIYGN